jgi:hypothetical protein
VSGDAHHAQPQAGRTAVARAVLLERGDRRIPVDLDDQPELRPARVDRVGADPLVRARRREAVVCEETQEPAFEAAARVRLPAILLGAGAARSPLWASAIAASFATVVRRPVTASCAGSLTSAPVAATSRSVRSMVVTRSPS